MHRRPLLELLRRHASAFPEQSEAVRRFESLIDQHEDCLERTCLPGHITASAWIWSDDGKRFLLTHHRKLDRWLQLGGHVDGDSDVPGAALREAREESGMQDFGWVEAPGEVRTVDLDIHRIPPFGGEPEHEHYDVRFVLRARPGQELVLSDESRDLRWFPLEEFDSLVQEESLERLGRRARERVEALR